ncbi:distal tail protein Dit [Streptococcus uberis]|uniref:distal tail protein Dit n=1 Tax=Streptococcus uberis TaxID=1349 RepID=UPI0020BFDC38|nr:distal tail protein Dit [Streptococcus uberis]
MKFNDKDLSDIITILKGFTPFGGANYELDTKDSVSNGVYFYKNRFREKILKVPFFVTYPTVERYDYLQSVLAVDEPKRLEFSHLPDRYYLAIPTGDLDFEEFRMNGKGIITFVIPDGVAHSITYKKVTDYTESDGKMIFNIVNKGNVDALPIITIKHNAENGYVGLVNQTGVMAVGDEEIVDSETRSHSLMPFDYTETGSGISEGLAVATKNVAILNDTAQILDKNLFIEQWYDREHLRLDSNVSPSGNHAGSITFDLPSEGSLYDYFWWRQVFWAQAYGQLGFIKITVSDTDGNFLYGVETIKRKKTLETEYNFFTTDGKGGFKNSNFMKQFYATELLHDNPFNPQGGWSDIIRKDDEVSVFWWGGRTTVYCPELKGKKSAKLHIAIGSMGGNPLVSRMYIDGIKYRKDNSYMPPNPFGSGSELIINSENDTLLVDNIPKINAMVNGSDFLKIPVGTSQLELYKSSWATTAPTVEIKFEERYL